MHLKEYFAGFGSAQWLQVKFWTKNGEAIYRKRPLKRSSDKGTNIRPIISIEIFDIKRHINRQYQSFVILSSYENVTYAPCAPNKCSHGSSIQSREINDIDKVVYMCFCKKPNQDLFHEALSHYHLEEGVWGLWAPQARVQR